MFSMTNDQFNCNCTLKTVYRCCIVQSSVLVFSSVGKKKPANCEHYTFVQHCPFVMKVWGNISNWPLNTLPNYFTFTARVTPLQFAWKNGSLQLVRCAWINFFGLKLIRALETLLGPHRLIQFGKIKTSNLYNIFLLPLVMKLCNVL